MCVADLNRRLGANDRPDDVATVPTHHDPLAGRQFNSHNLQIFCCASSSARDAATGYYCGYNHPLGTSG
jgi:hypothetical protein